MATSSVKKKRLYEAENLNLAYDAVKSKGISVYKAASQYGVPESTLRDRTLGVVQLNGNPGPKTKLTFDEEFKLKNHVEYMAELGYGYSRGDLLNIASDYSAFLGKIPNGTRLSKRWYSSFMKRWPDLKLKMPRKLAIQRAECASKEKINKYYKELSTIMTQNGLHDKPENIYNIDETGFSTEHSPSKVVCNASLKVQAITSPRGSNMTVIGSGNALGTSLPPYYVFPGKKWNPNFLDGTPTGSNGECTESGWSNSTVFKRFLQIHFLKYAQRNNDSPLLVLYDGHTSHVNPDLIQWARRNNIIFFVLPPHTSHLLQPLDVGCYGPLKQSYYHECRIYLRANPGKKVTKFEVGALSGTAYTKTMTPSNLCSSFRKTGIFPFKHTVPESAMKPATLYTSDYTDHESNENQNNTTNNDNITTTAFNDHEETPILPTASNNEHDETKQNSPSVFLDARSITSVNIKKSSTRRKRETVTGNIGKRKNVCIITASSQKKQKRSNQVKKGKINKTSKKQKQGSLHCSPVAGPSRPTPYVCNEGIHVDSSDDIYSDDDDDDNDDDDVCCVCNQFTPGAIRGCSSLVIVKWAKCDFCDHWTHLIYCSTVRVIRLGDQFRCPHCKDH